MLELGQCGRVALDVHEHVMRLVNLGDGIGELPPSPVFEAVDPSAGGGDHRTVTLDHRGHLLALVGMNNEYDFVMTHADRSLWTLVGQRLMLGVAGGLPVCGG